MSWLILQAVVLNKTISIYIFIYMKYYIGIDGGGSKTEAILVDSNNTVIGSIITSSANIKTDVDSAFVSISGAIDYLLNNFNINLATVKIGIGVAGYSDINNRHLLKNKLSKKYPHFQLSSDCHIACLAAHATNDGAVVICGTGVVAYYIKNKVSTQIGGWGFPHGDLGGGAWLGLEVCKLLCKAIDQDNLNILQLQMLYEDFFNSDANKFKQWLTNAKPQDYANITKFIFSSGQLDPSIASIHDRGLLEVSEFIQAVTNRTESLPIKIMGGLTNLYIKDLQQQFPNLTVGTNPPAFGAIHIVKCQR